jgi:invasion protein IalB
MMLNISKTLMIASLVAFASPLWAQDSTAADPATEVPAENTPVDPATDLSMGTPIDDGEIQVGQPYVREEFGDWAMRCLKAAEGPDPCQLYQLLLDEASNPVAEISMFPLPEGSRAAAGATIVVPLETLLTEQVTLSVDGSTPRRYPLTFCNAAGCVARVGFTAEEVAQFKAGNAATLTIVPAAAPDQVVTLAISLVGFTAGFDGTDPITVQP